MTRKFERIDLLPKNWVKSTYEKSHVDKNDRQTIVEDNDTRLRRRAAHQNLIDCFLKLVPHLMFSCQLSEPETFEKTYFDTWGFLDEPRFKGITVTGVKFVGKDEDGVKLIGRKTTTDGDVILLNGPIIYFDTEKKKYPFSDILQETIKSLKYEVEEYYRGKYSQDERQPEFDFK